MDTQSSNPVSGIVSLVVIVGAAAFYLLTLGPGGVILFVILLAAIALLYLIAGLRVIDQYERAVVLTLGKYSATREPGLRWILVGFQRLIKVDLRIRTIDIPQQEVITKDNVPVGI